MKKSLSQLGHVGLEQLVELGIQMVAPHRVVLFGSRARKSNRETSDFDIAFFFDQSQVKLWTEFLFKIEDSPLILFKVDWVDAERAQEELLAQIEKEGIVLYEAE